MDDANFIISTQYQQFDLPVSLDFYLQRPGVIESVVPSQGQRGTVVTITGRRLLGLGGSISLSRVLLGETEADITGDRNNENTIQIRAGGRGMPGNVSITINTTHTFTPGVFDGPYIFLANAWVLLEDVLVRDIVPPAAQPGKAVLLCGDRLLGGGNTISTLLLASQTTSQFNSTPLALESPASISEECVTAVVPTPQPGAMVTGRVVLTANTGAIVESTNNFTFAAINSVSPVRGQPGTVVTITGVALLSGYDTATPTVYLSGVQASVMTYDSTTVIVMAAIPPSPEGSGSGGTMTVSDLYGTAGDVEIVVPANFTSPTSFSVSVESRWTYLTPGEITSVSPAFGQFRTQIRINGSNLLGYGSALVRATVGGVDANIENTTESQVVLLTPDLGSNRQNVTIMLFSNSGAVIRGEDLFEYRERGTVMGTEPSRGQNGTYGEFTQQQNMYVIRMHAFPAVIT